MSAEELRQVRDTLIEALRRTDLLTLEGRALFRRYAAMSEAEAAAAGGAEVAAPVQTRPLSSQPGVQAVPADPAVQAVPAAPAVRRRPPAEEEDEFGDSFMVRSNPSTPTIPGYRETPSQPAPPVVPPRSMRDRRR